MEVSRLFNIEPIGVGTPYVESLPSYIKRLAEAHSVYPGALLKNEIFPEISSNYQLNSMLSGYNDWFSISSDIINDFIQILEIKTNNNKIHNLTLSKLSSYICSARLFRNHAAWCSLCFEESRRNNEPAYEQLIWSIRDIEICGKHGAPLHHVCPQCHRQIKYYNPKGRVGYCYHCMCWLGLGNLDGNSYKKLNKWDKWVFINIGCILSDIPKITEDFFGTNICETVNFASPFQKILEKKILVCQASIREWATKYKSPTLSLFLAFGYKFGLPINRLLFKNSNYRSCKKKSSKELSKVEFSILKQSIRKAVASTELISINDICIKYGVNSGIIKKLFPREYNLLKQKYIRQQEGMALEREAQIRYMMISLSERSIFPSISRIMSELDMHYIMSKRYSERYRKIWESTLRELGYTQEIGSDKYI